MNKTTEQMTHVQAVHEQQAITVELRKTQSRLRDCGQRNGELQGTIATLQGELDYTRTQRDTLLAALRKLFIGLEESESTADTLDALDNALPDMRAAIAQAEGNIIT